MRSGGREGGRSRPSSLRKETKRGWRFVPKSGLGGELERHLESVSLGGKGVLFLKSEGQTGRLLHEGKKVSGKNAARDQTKDLRL